MSISAKTGRSCLTRRQSLPGHSARLLAAADPGSDDRWHTFFGDIGFPGPDAGKGGKFLLLPPGYKGCRSRSAYYIYRSGTNNVFVFLRAFYQDPKNLKPPVDLILKRRRSIRSM